jgi:BetR domain
MESNRSQAFQIALFAHIFSTYDQKKVIPTLCDLLHLNKSSVYARIKGERSLQLEEVFVLSEHFGIPIHQLIHRDAQSTVFTGMNPYSTAQQYCQQILAGFSPFLGDTNQKMWVTSDELPFLQFLYFRELSLFKLFAYARVNWQLDYADNLRFDPDTFPEKSVYEDILKPISDIYNGINSVEYWSDNIYTNALRHIVYFYQIGQIAHRDIAMLLFDQLEALADHQYNMCTEGKKWPVGQQAQKNSPTWQLYQNSMFHSSITILGESDQKKTVFMVYDDPNYFNTTDPNFCDYTKNWMKKLQQKCINISTEGENYRRVFFNQIKASIDQYRSKCN